MAVRREGVMTIQTTIVRRSNGRKAKRRPWQAWLAERPGVFEEGGTQATAVHKLRTRITSRPRLAKRFRTSKTVVEELVV